MPYRNTATGKLEPLPWRIVLPDGSTRTDPTQWWNDLVVREICGYIESEIMPEDITPESNVIPQTISARQIRLWLVRHGFQLNQIESIIEAIEDPIIRETVKIEWEYAPYVERTHPWLVPLAQSLGLNEEQIDQAFREASLI